VREPGGVPIPFASPRLLRRMKAVTHGEKDAGDLYLLRHWFAKRGEERTRVWSAPALFGGAVTLLPTRPSANRTPVPRCRCAGIPNHRRL
jgi:hypothetical protein